MQVSHFAPTATRSRQDITTKDFRGSLTPLVKFAPSKTVSHEHHDLYAVPRHSRVRAHATHTHTHTHTHVHVQTHAHVRTRAQLVPRSSSAHLLLSLPSAAVASAPVPFAHTPAACIACRRHHHLSALRSLSQAWQSQGLGQGGHWRRQLVQADDEELRQVSALAWAAMCCPVATCAHARGRVLLTVWLCSTCCLRLRVTLCV